MLMSLLILRCRFTICNQIGNQQARLKTLAYHRLEHSSSKSAKNKFIKHIVIQSRNIRSTVENSQN